MHNCRNDEFVVLGAYFPLDRLDQFIQACRNGFRFLCRVQGWFQYSLHFCFLCLMDDYCSKLVCNVNVPAVQLCETRYTFPVNCLTERGIGM